MILDRIKEYIDFKGISLAAFERSIGMSNASFSKSLKNNGAIGTDKLENILKIYEDISAEWLLTGKGDMIKEVEDSTEQNQPSLIHGTIHERIQLIIKERAGGKNTVFADKLGTSEANIRGYVNNVTPKADILGKIVIMFDINAMWLLTGLGYMSLPNQPEDVPKPLTDQSALSDFFAQYEPYIQKKDAKIIQQAEEIGRLRERISYLEREKGKDVSDAQTSGVANAG